MQLIQNSNAHMKIKAKMKELEKGIVNILDKAEVKVVISYKNHKVVKLCTPIPNEDAVMCSLEPQDLKETGNYSYQAVAKYENGVVKQSPIQSFYVAPALDFTEEEV